MVNRFLILFLLNILFSCGVQENKKEEKIYYIIKHPKYKFVSLDNNKYQNDSLPPPLPALLPFIIYGEHNFILADTSSIYYYYYKSARTCDEGANDTIQINLSSEKIKAIPINDLSDFLNKIIPDSIQDMREITASISYPTDTIRNRGFEIISEHFKKKGVRTYNIRNLTGEEKTPCSRGYVAGRDLMWMLVG